MYFIHDLRLNVLKMYLYTRNDVYRSRLSRVSSPQTTDTQTDRCDRMHYQPTFAGVNDNDKDDNMSIIITVNRTWHSCSR